MGELKTKEQLDLELRLLQEKRLLKCEQLRIGTIHNSYEDVKSLKAGIELIDEDIEIVLNTKYKDMK